MTQADHVDLTFQIHCDKCAKVVYEKGINVLSSAVVIMQESLKDVQSAIEAHKMVCDPLDSNDRYSLR